MIITEKRQTYIGLPFLLPKTVKAYKSSENANSMAFKRLTAPETPDIKTAQGKERNMDFLKMIFDDELYEKVKEALDAYNGDEANKDKQVKLGNLAGGEYVSKHKYDDLQTQLSSKGEELTTANNLIEELKKGTKGNEELQGKVTAYETQVAELQDKLKQTQLDSAIKVALLGAKANDLEYMTFKIKEKGELELSEDGSIKGIDDKIAGLKTQYPNQFEAAAGSNIEPNPLQSGSGSKTEPQSLEEALRMQYEGDN